MNESFISQLAQPQPIPAGGAAAAHVACIALALLEKIVRLEIRRSGNSPDESGFWDDLLARVQAVSERVLRLREEDGKAYTALVRAKASKESNEWARALDHATQTPLTIVEAACEALTLVSEAGTRCGAMVLADLLAACEFLNGAGKAAGHVVSANMQLMDDAGKSIHSLRLARSLDELSAGFQNGCTVMLSR